MRPRGPADGRGRALRLVGGEHVSVRRASRWAAFSTARRAWVSTLSDAGRAVAPAAPRLPQLVEGELVELGRERVEAVGEVVVPAGDGDRLRTVDPEATASVHRRGRRPCCAVLLDDALAGRPRRGRRAQPGRAGTVGQRLHAGRPARAVLRRLRQLVAHRRLRALPPCTPRSPTPPASLLGPGEVRFFHEHVLVKEPGHGRGHAVAPRPAVLLRRRRPPPQPVGHRSIRSPPPTGWCSSPGRTAGGGGSCHAGSSTTCRTPTATTASSSCPTSTPRPTATASCASTSSRATPWRSTSRRCTPRPATRAATCAAGRCRSATSAPDTTFAIRPWLHSPPFEPRRPGAGPTARRRPVPGAHLIIRGFRAGTPCAEPSHGAKPSDGSSVRPRRRPPWDGGRRRRRRRGATHTRVGADHGRGARAGRGPLDGGQLAVPDRTGQLGLQRRVGAAGAAAQPFVVELDHVGHVPDHGPHGQVGALHVAQVARVLHDHRVHAAAGGREPVEPRRPATRGRRRPAPRTPPLRPSRADGRSPSAPRRTLPS